MNNLASKAGTRRLISCRYSITYSTILSRSNQVGYTTGLHGINSTSASTFSPADFILCCWIANFWLHHCGTP